MATRAVSISLTSNRVTMYRKSVCISTPFPFGSKSTDSRVLNKINLRMTQQMFCYVTRNDAFFDPYHKNSLGVI